MAGVFLLAGAVQQVHAQSFRVLPLGDSITRGTQGDTSYRYELENLMGQDGCTYDMVGPFTNNGSSYNGSYAAWSGARTDTFVRWVTSDRYVKTLMEDHTPDIVLVHLGSNDINQGQPVTGAYNSNGLGGTVAEIEEVVTKIWNENANAEIFVANVIPWLGSSGNSNVTSDMEFLGDEIEAWVAAEADSRLHLVDVRSGFQSGSMFLSDLIHPNAAGSAHIANAFWGKMTTEGVCAGSVPSITTPVANSTLSGATQAFTWSDNGYYQQITEWWLSVGPSPGSGSYFNQSLGLGLGVTVSGLPTDGSTVYAQLWYRANNVWVSVDSLEYTAATVADNTPPTTYISSPGNPGDTVAGTHLFTGTATDVGGSGFKNVRVAIEDNNNGGGDRIWYDFQAQTLSTTFAFDFAVIDPATITTSYLDWEITASLPTGDYTVFAMAEDNSGNRYYGNWPTNRQFFVGGLGAASLLAPSGTSDTGNPTFTWTAVSNSTWYYLYADDSNGTQIRKWYTASSAGCGSGTTCSVDSPATVSDNVSWKVRTWNNVVGYGPWSSTLSFTVNTAPGKPILYTPVGSGAGSLPTYSWSASSNSSWYYLWVNDSTGTPIKQWYSLANLSCTASVCSVTPSTPITGSATWWVQGWNITDGLGPWSDGSAFSP